MTSQNYFEIQKEILLSSVLPNVVNNKKLVEIIINECNDLDNSSKQINNICKVY